MRRESTTSHGSIARSGWVAALLITCASVLPAASPAVASSSPPRSAKEEVRDALEKGEYDWYDSSTDGPRLERLRHELDDPHAKSEKWGWLAWLLNGIALSVLLSIVIYLARAARRARRTTAPKPEIVAEPRTPRALPVADPELGFDPAAWLSAAHAAADRGDFAHAIVCLFNGQLLLLDRARAIRLEPGRTNHQHLAGLARESAVRESFRRSIETFERVFYGGRPADRVAYERFRGDHDSLVEGIATRNAA